MVSGITPRLHVSSPAGVQPAVCPKPPSGPEGPNDGVDLSNIDTPQEAAQLPILDAGFQLGLAGAIVGTMMASGGNGAAAPLIELCFQSVVGENCAKIDYVADAKEMAKGGSPLVSSGELNGQPVEGGITVDPSTGSLGWRANYGGSPENFSFGVNEQKTLDIAGKLGSVDAKLNFSVIGDLSNPTPESIQGFKVSGTLGDQPYEATTLFQLNPGAQPGPDGKIDVGTATTQGSLGNLVIDRQFVISAQQTGSGILANAVGTGVNAGLESITTTDLTFVP